MRRRLHGIALILVSILLTMVFGMYPFFGFSFLWSVVFAVMGIVGCVLVFLPEGEER